MAVKMFYARIDNSGEFRKVLEVVKDLVPLVNLQINQQGVSFESNESLHVVQVRLRVSLSYFSEFKCTGSFSIGVSLADLYTIMKIGLPDDSLVLEHEEGSSVMKVALEAAKLPKVCEFSLNLLNLCGDDCSYVEVQNAGRFEMSAKELYHTCHDLSQVSEFLAISLNKMRVKFSVSSELAGGCVSLKQLRGENGMHIQTIKTVNTEINLIYAKRITRAHVLAERVEVRVYPDEPVGFHYAFNGIELKFYLAPAISE